MLASCFYTGARKVIYQNRALLYDFFSYLSIIIFFRLKTTLLLTLMLSVIYMCIFAFVYYWQWLGIAIEPLNISQENCFLTCVKMPVSLRADIMTFFFKT